MKIGRGRARGKSGRVGRKLSSLQICAKLCQRIKSKEWGKGEQNHSSNSRRGSKASKSLLRQKQLEKFAGLKGVMKASSAKHPGDKNNRKNVNSRETEERKNGIEEVLWRKDIKSSGFLGKERGWEGAIIPLPKKRQKL